MPRLCSLPGSAPRPCDDGGVELCDHPCRTAARCGVKRAVNGCELRGPRRRPRVQTARRPRRPLCPGPLRPCEPLLIEVQPPVGASQRGPGRGSVQNNYYVTLVSFTTQDRGGVKYSTNVWKEGFFLKSFHRVKIKRFHSNGFVFSLFSLNKRWPKGDICAAFGGGSRWTPAQTIKHFETY